MTTSQTVAPPGSSLESRRAVGCPLTTPLIHASPGDVTKRVPPSSAAAAARSSPTQIEPSLVQPVPPTARTWASISEGRTRRMSSAWTQVWPARRSMSARAASSAERSPPPPWACPQPAIPNASAPANASSRTTRGYAFVPQLMCGIRTIPWSPFQLVDEVRSVDVITRERPLVVRGDPRRNLGRISGQHVSHVLGPRRAPAVSQAASRESPARSPRTHGSVNDDGGSQDGDAQCHSHPHDSCASTRRHRTLEWPSAHRQPVVATARSMLSHRRYSLSHLSSPSVDPPTKSGPPSPADEVALLTTRRVSTSTPPPIPDAIHLARGWAFDAAGRQRLFPPQLLRQGDRASRVGACRLPGRHSRRGGSRLVGDRGRTFGQPVSPRAARRSSRSPARPRCTSSPARTGRRAAGARGRASS
ncbi:MAG: hypothetical protein KatS3mg065_1046 [Chloroflexota bacterium]|nr:MAG: hypothetical protein KatS3mg065_1046 [Chloroflexota bacterium]